MVRASRSLRRANVGGGLCVLGRLRDGDLRFRAVANTDPAEADRLQDLAQQTVRQRWQIYEQMATRRAGDFPANAREDH